MARRARKNSPRKGRSDPGQLGLFDMVETRAPAHETAPLTQQRRTQTRRSKSAPPSVSERPIVLSPREAAQYLGVSVSTLKAWRAKKIGPKWTMRGARLIAYRPADLERFLDDNNAGR